MSDSRSKNNNDDQWSHAVSYAKRCGGIIPGKAISFRVKPASYTLKSHWGRWVLISVLIAVMLFHFLPMLLPILIPSDKEFPFAKTLPMVFFGFFWLYLAFRLSMPIGRITFDKERSEIRILYGTIFHRHKIVIPTEHITLKAYMFKADKPDVRIRYGNTVLSLINQNESDSELILAATRSEKKIYSVLAELNRHFNKTTLSGISGESNNAFSSLLKDTPEDEWQQLAEKSQTKKAFLLYFNSRANTLITKDNPEHILIKNRKPWFFGVFLLAFGLFMVSMPFIVMFKDHEFRIFLMLMSIGASLIFLVPTYTILASVNRILLKHLDNSIYLKYGFYPFVKEVSFPRNELEVRLYKCSIKQANKVKKPGQIVFSIIRKSQNDSELILTVYDTEPQALCAFKKLESFIGHSQKHELSENVELPSGEQLSVSKSSLLGNATEGKKRRYCIVSDNRVAFKSHWFYIAMFAFLFIMGLFVTFGFMTDEPAEKMSQRVISTVLVFGAAGLMILGGMGCCIYFLLTRCIIADKKSDSLYYSPFTGTNIKGKLIIKLSEIKAIQFCSVYTSVQSGNSRRGTTIYEINAITDRIDDKRIGITCSEKHDQMSIDANAFAGFLGVPLLDHTTT